MLRASTPLVHAAIAHLVLAAICAALLAIELPAIGGVHPAVKPLKFALSIAALLGTLAFVLPAMALDGRTRAILCWVLAITMLVEMLAIATQAMRGESSHFNTRTVLDAAIWRVMMLAILAALAALIAIAVLASIRPLALEPLLATAVRIALWMLLLTAISGFAMGGRGQHAVGGADGGDHLPVVGWSREHGDLRAPHFFAMHALQVLPGAALVLLRLPIAERGRWIVFAAIAIGWTALAVGTLGQALVGWPLWR